MHRYLQKYINMCMHISMVTILFVARFFYCAAAAQRLCVFLLRVACASRPQTGHAAKATPGRVNFSLAAVEEMPRSKNNRGAHFFSPPRLLRCRNATQQENTGVRSFCCSAAAKLHQCHAATKLPGHIGFLVSRLLRCRNAAQQ